jgi:hypothetical protein
MRRLAWLTSGGFVIAALAIAPIAAADTVRALSTPNGDLWATSSSGAVTDKDHDGNFNTVKAGDRIGLHWSVANNAPAAQTIHITAVLDGPGTAADMTLADQDFTFGPSGDPLGSSLEQDFTELHVKRNSWPEGTYSLAVTGSGSEDVAATSTFTVSHH